MNKTLSYTEKKTAVNILWENGMVELSGYSGNSIQKFCPSGVNGIFYIIVTLAKTARIFLAQTMIKLLRTTLELSAFSTLSKRTDLDGECVDLMGVYALNFKLRH